MTAELNPSSANVSWDVSAPLSTSSSCPRGTSGARGEIEVPPATITVWGCSVGTGTVKIKHQGRTIGTHTIMVLARTVSFSASSYSVTEGGSVGIRVTMSPAANRDYTIPITVTRRTAESTDYSVLGLPAVFNGESQGYVPRVHDHGEAGHGQRPMRRWSSALAGCPPAWHRVRLSMATLTITDDDPDEVDGRTVSFSAERYPGSEGSNVSVTVNMSPAADGKYTIPITASDNTNHSVTFSSGDESASFDYPAGQNSLCDLNPDVTLDFGASLPSGVEEGSRSTATVTIANDDTCKVQFSPVDLLGERRLQQVDHRDAERIERPQPGDTHNGVAGLGWQRDVQRRQYVQDVQLQGQAGPRLRQRDGDSRLR